MPASPAVAPVLDSEAALDEFVRAERVRFAFIQSPLPMLFSPMSAATLCLALWNSADRKALSVWAVGTAVIAAARVLLVRTYPKDSPAASAVARWERAFVASIVVVDLWWGLGCLVILPEPLASQVLVFSFLMLMAGGHAASYAAHAVTVSLGVLSLALPITILFALKADAFHRAMAFASTMYLVATFRSIRTLGYFFARSHHLARDVQVERERAERLARTDFLTGLNNRRAFYEIGETSLRQAQRYSRDAALLMIDIDHFKSINDRFGHAAGDAVIRGVGQSIVSTVRNVDIAGRLGGEEFTVLLPETSAAEARVAAERLRRAIGESNLEHQGQPLPVTVSLGVASLRAEDDLEAVIARADAALYRAKHEGRNRVVVEAAQEPSPAASPYGGAIA
jgi:diguanylate cyclase (GGDEF)-like protein